MKLLGLDHIQLAMPAGEEAAARRFYGDLLGLEEEIKPEPLQARGGCWFVGLGTIIHLGVETPFAPARKAHPAFRVADLRACCHELEAAGFDVTPDETLPNVHRCYAADPFGNRLEFIQDGGGFSQRAT